MRQSPYRKEQVKKVGARRGFSGALGMWNDPIVEETRRIRDEIAARFNYDVEALGRYYQAQQSKENRVVVRRAAKKEPRETEEATLVRD